MSGAIQMMLGISPGFVFQQTISANTLNYNLRNAALAAGWDGIKPLAATVTVASGIVVGSSSTGAYAFDTGASFPPGSSLKLINNGTIVGRGGNGGSGGNGGTGAGGGGVGGPALRTQASLTILNQGVIGGGGSGGAGHPGFAWSSGESEYSEAGGGGGGGAGYIAGGGGGGGSNGFITASSGGSGSLLGGGGGGFGSGGTGGSGSGLGSGACTSGNANITWEAVGTRLGTLG